MKLQHALCAVLLLAGTVCAQAGQGRHMSVAVRQGTLRATPSHFGATVATVGYGQQVAVQQENGDWFKVSLTGPSREGWMHKSALTTQELRLQAGQTAVNTMASQDELAMAGKGFNPQVEAAFKSKNPSLAYTLIDRMEQVTIPESEMVRFLKQGGLKGGGSHAN